VWIRIGFNADPDRAFYLNADPDQESQINADSDPGLTLLSKKLNFYMKNILKVGNRSKNIPTIHEGTKAFKKGRKTSSFFNCGQFSYS
jgi:hypothetical protein